MKKRKIMAAASIAALMLPFGVNAEAIDITQSGTSSADATVENIDISLPPEMEDYIGIEWGDLKFNYTYTSEDGSQWEPVVSEDFVTEEEFGLASNHIEVFGNKNIKTHLAFTASSAFQYDNGPEVVVEGEITNEKAGQVIEDRNILTDNTMNLTSGYQVNYYVSLYGGDPDVLQEMKDSNNKKIGTFTLTFEDAD